VATKALFPNREVPRWARVPTCVVLLLAIANNPRRNYAVQMEYIQAHAFAISSIVLIVGIIGVLVQERLLQLSLALLGSSMAMAACSLWASQGHETDLVQTVSWIGILSFFLLVVSRNPSLGGNLPPSAPEWPVEI
jgi:xanthosine utilization system XapX-like protein